MKNTIRLDWKDDGLPTLSSGPWVEDKYRLLAAYIDMFSTGMVNKWDERVYIDLYAGPGCASIRHTTKILRGSPLLALSVKNPFDKYIFCDKCDEYSDALKKRCDNNFAGRDIVHIRGDCNDRVDEIFAEIPPHSRSHKVLSFCFVDPFSLDLHFQTIKKLSTKFVDFMVLLALDMDARRNTKNYFRSSNDKVEKFLGMRGWRDKWTEVIQVDNSFQRFLAGQFERQMLDINYLKHSKANTKHISTHDENLPLYHLAFFSRSKIGYQFWDECLKYSTDQPSFEF